MRKYLQIIVVLGAFFLLVFLKNTRVFHDDEEEGRVIAPPQLTTPQPTSSAGTGATTTTGSYKDGTYTGSTEDAFYGNIQIQAVISGGKLVDVVPLQYPNDNRTSISINTQALPLLKQEAIRAQSATVDMISGASDTSPAFVRSLANALNQAK